MLCDRCKKRDAKILYTEIIHGVKKEQHLCEECSTEYTSFQMEKSFLNSDISLNDLLSAVLDAYYRGMKEKGQIMPEAVCSKCQTSYEEFLQKGRFGCAECYKSFSELLGTTLKGIQGADTHIGKRPKGFQPQTVVIPKDIPEKERLSIKLQQAIEKEEFEEAARLRDMIREIKEAEINNA